MKLYHFLVNSRHTILIFFSEPRRPNYFFGGLDLLGRRENLLSPIHLIIIQQLKYQYWLYMSGIYYRRWTRMFIHPAAKYFKKYDVLEPGMEQYMYLINKQNPIPENKRFFKKQMVNHEQQINNKLIKNLFLKYPDLKYQSINRQKYQGDNFNSYSFSFSFITQQKKLMKAGYTMRKAFEIVEQKFQEKMKRKLDQTLLSKGLAIGNRARSLLTIYQQQVEYQSRLKMLRTKRQVAKYQDKLKQIEQSIKRSVGDEKQQNQEYYERIFQKITDKDSTELNKQFENQKRPQLITRINNDFENMFSQFYEPAAYRDKLRGLTDDQIKQEILTSPKKIKELSAKIIKYLKSKGDISISGGGQIIMGDTINEKLKSFIHFSPTIKIAILNHLLGYQSPQFSIRRKIQNETMSKLKSLRTIRPTPLDQEAKKLIKENKIKQLQQFIGKDFPEDSRAYKLLESKEQRMLRLEIKYLQGLITNKENSSETTFKQLKDVIQKFRRLKFRMQKRYKSDAAKQFAFPEHFAFGAEPNKIQDMDIQYEDLIEYLRKKSQERRLKTIDQVSDNKISQMIKKESIKQVIKVERDDDEMKN